MNKDDNHRLQTILAQLSDEDACFIYQLLRRVEVQTRIQKRKGALAQRLSA